MQSNSQPHWPRLAEAVVSARIGRGFIKRAAWARHIEIDPSTMAIIEGARPGAVSEEMLDYVVSQLGWQPGAWARYLGGDPSPDRDDTGPTLTGATDEELLGEVERRILGARQEPRRAANG